MLFGYQKVAGSLISVFRQILSFQDTFSFCGNGMKEDIIVPDRFICLQINSAANIYVFSGGECVLSFFSVANPDHVALLGSKSCSDKKKKTGLRIRTRSLLSHSNINPEYEYGQESRC